MDIGMFRIIIVLLPVKVYVFVHIWTFEESFLGPYCDRNMNPCYSSLLNLPFTCRI